MLTNFPGDAHLQAIEDFQARVSDDQCHLEKVQRFINPKLSKGNYFVDTDGNTVLDFNAAAAGAPLGYNNDAL